MTPAQRIPAPRLSVLVLALIGVVAVAVAAALAATGQLARIGDDPAPAVVTTQKPGFAEASPEELRGSLMTQADLPKYLAMSSQAKSPVTAQRANPPDCFPELFSGRRRAPAQALAYAPDFTGMFYDGRYAVELLLRPKDEEASLLGSARSWLARCGSFTVSLNGSPEAYPAYAVPIPTSFPGSEGSLGVKVMYALAKSDPFRNEVFYCALARVRDIDVLVVSGLPGVAEDLAGKAVARLAHL